MNSERGYCIYCKFFVAFDGVDELWTDCELKGTFKGAKRGDCPDWKGDIS